MRNLIKRLFCRHRWKVLRWRYFHGYSGNEPTLIETECQCRKCGKIDYFVVPRKDRAAFEEQYKEMGDSY